MALIELKESHDFAEIKLAVEIVIKCRAELVHRVLTQIDVVSITIIHEQGHTIQVVLLDTLLEESRQVPGVYG